MSKCSGCSTTRKSSLHAFVKPGMSPLHKYKGNSIMTSYWSEHFNGRSGKNKYLFSLYLRCYLFPMGGRRERGYISIMIALFSKGFCWIQIPFGNCLNFLSWLE